MVITSTLNELWLNTDDVAKYPSRSYVVVVPAAFSGTFSRLYRSVANVVSFCGPEGKSTPTSLPVSQALVPFYLEQRVPLGVAVEGCGGVCQARDRLLVALAASELPFSSSSSSSSVIGPANVDLDADMEADVGGHESKTMDKFMDQQYVRQMVESCMNEAKHLCAVMKGATAKRIEKVRGRLGDYVRQLREWKTRVGDLGKVFL